MNNLALIGPLGTPEVLLLAVLGLLIFGKRLPEVGRSLGKGIVEFKKGLSGVADDAEESPARPDVSRRQVVREDPAATIDMPAPDPGVAEQPVVNKTTQA